MTSARERIIEATLTLVAEQGLSGITMVAVAKAAGVARATLYNHYPDIPSILADAAELHNQHAIEGLRRALAVVADPRDAVEQLVRHIAAISTHGHALTTHQSFPPELRGQLDAFNTELEERIRDILADGIATGAFRSDLDPDITTALLRHALVGVSDVVAAAPERASSVAGHAVSTLLAAITGPPETD